MIMPRILPNNAPGKYFVTEECDGCAYCASVAPDHFEYEKSTNTYYVIRQPRTPDEHELVWEALDACPLDAIDRTPEPLGEEMKS
jgi:ferredoxin